MRFLILTQYFPPEVGAPQTRLSAFAHELIASGHAVQVVTALPNYPTGRIFQEYRNRWYVSEKWNEILVHRVWVYASTGAGLKRMANYVSFLGASLLGLYRSCKPDWIFVESPPPTLALSGLLASRLWHVPLIVNVADLWPDSIRALGLMQNKFLFSVLERLERFVYRKARFVNAVTQGIRKRLIEAKSVEPTKVTFLPNGVDTEFYRPLPVDESLKTQLGLSGKKIILYAGTHGYAHGLEHIVDAAAILQDENVHFLFVGDGSEKPRLIRRALDLQLKNITFTDPVPVSQIPRLLSISECGLVPQRKLRLFEGNRPAKTFSVMACAKPVVFSGDGEGAQLVSDARAGCVVAPEDASAVVGAIRLIVRDPFLAREFGRNGREFVKANLTWSALVGNWLEQLRAAPQMTVFPTRNDSSPGRTNVHSL